MINICTSKDKLSKDSIIIDNESFFRNWTVGGCFCQLQKDVMSKIDNAVMIDDNLRKIQTPYGITGVNDLSTGCKTVLNYLYLHDHGDKFKDVYVINAIECGKNALDVLFDVMESQNELRIVILLEHSDGVASCKKRDYCINNERHVTSLFEM